MGQNRFDRLAKRVAQRGLSPTGIVVLDDEVQHESQHADVRYEPDPRKTAERRALGLLGRMGERVCLIEPYSGTPDLADFRACLRKHLAFWHELEKRPSREAPVLWIVSSGRPESLLDAFGLLPKGTRSQPRHMESVGRRGEATKNRRNRWKARCRWHLPRGDSEHLGASGGVFRQ